MQLVVKFFAVYILLKGTNIHFSKSILPVSPVGYGTLSGQYTLSDDKKSITASVAGECAWIYFGREKFANGILPFLTHEVPVMFDNIGKTFSQSKLVLFFSE